MQFRHGDRADIRLFLQNVSDQETECGFDPVDVCKWHNSPWPDPLKQEPVEVLRIKQHNGEVVEPEPLRNSDGSRVTYIIAPLSSNYAKLLPQEIRRIDGQLSASDRTGRPVPVKEFVGFHIVAQKSAEPARQHPQEYVLPSGKHTAAIAINVFKVGKQFRLECPALEFVVVDGTPQNAPANTENLTAPGAVNATAVEKPLDRHNARAVVEAFVAATFPFDDATFNTLARLRDRSEAGVEALDDLKVARLPIQSVYVNDPAKPTRALATSEAVRLEEKLTKHGQRNSVLVFTLTMSDKDWLVTDIDIESTESADRELKKFLEANPKSISVPLQAASNSVRSAEAVVTKLAVGRETLSTPNATSPNPDLERIQGEWRLAHVFHHSTLTRDSSCVIGKSSLVVGHKADQPPHKYVYTLRRESEIDLRPSIPEGLGAPLLGRYLFKDNRLYIAFNNDPNTKERPVYATMEDPNKDVTLLIFEFVGRVDSKEKSIDRQNARAVVEAFVAAALAGDRETVITLAKRDRRDPKRVSEGIEKMIEYLPDREHLPMTSVHVNDAANPTEAIAISEPFKWVNPRSERKTDRPDEVVWFTLSMSEAGWIVTDISTSFEWIGSSATDDLLKKFLEANPNAIGMPTLTESATNKK